MINVTVIDDHKEYASALCSVISSQDDMTCIGVATTPDRLIMHNGLNPDVILLDLNFYGNLSGLDFIRILKTELPETDIIILTIHEEDDILFAALRNGAVGYLTKNSLRTENIVDFIRIVYNGGAAMTMGIARKIMDSFHADEKIGFTEREFEVLDLLCKGSGYKTIAERLYIEKSTVKFHIKNIYHKLGAHNKGEALIEAKKRKLF